MSQGWITSTFFHPAIARLSDEQYDALVEQAKRKRGDAAWVLPLGAGVAALVGWLGFSALLIRIVRQVAAPGGPLTQIVTDPATGASRVVTVWPGVPGTGQWWGGSVVVALLLALAAAALCRHALITRSVRSLVNRGGCPFCEFSLVGLKVDVDNAVVCPECGERVFLHEHRIKREDVELFRAPIGAGPRGAHR